MTIGTAGLPIDLLMSRDYDAIFSTLAASGVDVFSPTTIYQEYPVELGLGLETDLLPPPYGTATTELYDLARSYNIKIAFSADYMFPVANGGVNPASSPLQAIIDAGGRDIIHSIVNYDEPVLNGHAVSLSQAVYEHVKDLDPTLQVVQVHAPVGSGDATAYLDQVKLHAAWADVVGFDVYPIGGTESGARTPYNPDILVQGSQALSEYMTWLEAEFPAKQHIMVLQAFEKLDLYSDAMVNNMTPAELATSREPTLLEMREMMIAVQNADMVFWWGASLQDSATASVWQNQLTVSQMAATNNLGTPIGALSDINAAADTFDEDAANGSFVGVTLDANDADAIDSVTYTLDDARFGVDASGRVYIVNNSSFDYESESSITINATARSTDGSSSTTSFTLAVNDVMDQYNGTIGNDEIHGNTGSDSINAGMGNDAINAYGGNDLVIGGAGHDLVMAGGGDDTVRGGGGNDIMVGEGGNDSITGYTGADSIMGGSGNDTLDGGAGEDMIIAVSGSNVIRGGGGFDMMQAGTGADRFEFVTGDDTDYIFDFNVAQDTLVFSGPSSMADLTLYEIGTVAVIEYEEGQIGLFGVDLADLTNANFEFV